MMKTRLFRNVMAFLFLIAASTSALEAKAATYNLGTLSPGAIGIGGFPQGLHFGFPGSTFTDHYVFSVAVPSDLQAAAIAFNLPIIIGFSSFSASLTAGGPVLATSTGTPGFFSLVFSNLAPSTVYSLDVTGKLGSLSIVGKYWGVMQLSAVPVPAALPLFASGLAAFGVFARRRRKQIAA